jgi:hypothetical protein
MAFYDFEKAVIEFLELNTGITWIRYADSTSPTAPRPATPYGTIRFQGDAETTPARIIGRDVNNKKLYRVNKNITLVLQVNGEKTTAPRMTPNDYLLQVDGLMRYGDIKSLNLVFIDRLAMTDIPQAVNATNERRAQADYLMAYTYDFSAPTGDDIVTEVRYNVKVKNPEGGVTYESDETA